MGVVIRDDDDRRLAGGDATRNGQAVRVEDDDLVVAVAGDHEGVAVDRHVGDRAASNSRCTQQGGVRVLHGHADCARECTSHVLGTSAGCHLRRH
jgi:hypothetical protein